MNMTTSTRRAGDITIVDVSGRIVLGKESASVRIRSAFSSKKGPRNKVLGRTRRM